jgi:hypothetical protein
MSTPPSNSGSELGDRIAAVKSSLRCFVYSLIGLVPLIGIPFAIAAVVRGRQVSGVDRLGWNPGDRYLKAARRLGPLGFLTSAIFLLAVFVVLPALLGDGGGCSSGHG